MSLREFLVRAERGHAEQVARGEHDEQCEWRPHSLMCHCPKRRREAVGFTTVPDLEWSTPICTRCDNPTNPDTGGGFDCETCHVHWDSSGNGEFTDDYGDLPADIRGLFDGVQQ